MILKSSPVCSLCVCPVCLQTGIHLPLIPKQLLACPPIRRIRNRDRSLLTWWLCSKERHGSPCVPSLSKWSHDPRHDPPSTTTRRGGLWGQVRCKQIQYTLHCMEPQGSWWSYSRGTNHFGSRFACFFLLYFPEGRSSPRRERYPATHRYHHTGLFTFPSPRLIEWAPFWKCTSTGLLSVQAGDHRAERGKVHTVCFLYIHFIQLYRQWGFLSLSYQISALSVWLASYWCFSGPAFCLKFKMRIPPSFM